MVCVRPGDRLIRASLPKFASAFSKLDFPTFERPIKAISCIWSRGKSGGFWALLINRAELTFTGGRAWKAHFLTGAFYQLLRENIQSKSTNANRRCFQLMFGGPVWNRSRCLILSLFSLFDCYPFGSDRFGFVLGPALCRTLWARRRPA